MYLYVGVLLFMGVKLVSQANENIYIYIYIICLFENRVLSRMLQPKEHEVTGG
jgi:hypothetical protein